MVTRRVPPHKKPMKKDWTFVGYLDPAEHGQPCSLAYQHKSGVIAISSIIWINDEHEPEFHWEWLVSFSHAGLRCLRNSEIKWCLNQWQIQDFEEDNHEPGIARKFWLAVDPKFRKKCPCKDEVIIKKGDYEYSVKKDQLDKVVNISGETVGYINE